MVLDLVQMIRAPLVAQCPQCEKHTDTHFENYNAGEMQDVNPQPGEWSPRVTCEHCGHEWTQRLTVRAARR
jgi:ribosomal protein L44E